MSGYYLDLHDGRLLTPSNAGWELDDLDAGGRWGAEAAAQIKGDYPSSNGDVEASTEAHTEPSQRVLWVSASMQFTRVIPPPVAPSALIPLETSQPAILATVKLLA
jgi:hypothetical protein